MPERKSRIWARLTAGRRATFLDWVTVAAIVAVLGVFFYRGAFSYFTAHGLPDWYYRYHKAERQFFAKYWPNGDARHATRSR